MTVQELIDKLSKLSDKDKQLKVCYADYEYGPVPIDSIEDSKDGQEPIILLR